MVMKKQDIKIDLETLEQVLYAINTVIVSLRAVNSILEETIQLTVKDDRNIN